MAYLQMLWTWSAAHPIATLAIVLYIVVNVAPRPHGSDASGWKGILWETLDRLAILTSGALPGRFKLLLAQTKKPAVVAASRTITEEPKEKTDGGQ